MAFTFQNYYQHLQRKLKDTTTETLPYIKRLVNAAYKWLLAFNPTFWTESVTNVAIATNDTVVDLPESCMKLIGLDYPAGDTSGYTPVVVNQQDWESFRQPPTATGKPQIFYAAGYQTSGSTNYMQLYLFPACGTSYIGSYPVRYYKLPGDMSADGDVPVFDDRWQELLLSRCEVEALRYDQNYEAAIAMEQAIQQQVAAFVGHLEKADKGK
jgi:hypothetical protein